MVSQIDPGPQRQNRPPAAILAPCGVAATLKAGVAVGFAMRSMGCKRLPVRLMPARIVLDTSVLLAGLRSRRGASYRLLSALGQPEIITVVSVPLMLEYEAVLRRNAAELAMNQDDIDAVLDYIGSVSEERVFLIQVTSSCSNWRSRLDAGTLSLIMLPTSEVRNGLI